MGSFYYVIALLTGVVLTVQIAANGTAGRYLSGRPLLATFANFATGMIVLTAYLLLSRTEWPAKHVIASVPWWAWAGGVLGICYVTASTVAGPRLGAATFLSLVVLGQMLSSLAVDHYGWLGFAQHPVSVSRIAGACLLLAGVMLITR